VYGGIVLIGGRVGGVFKFIPLAARDGDGCPEMEKPLRDEYIPSNGNVPARDGLAGGTPPPPPPPPPLVKVGDVVAEPPPYPGPNPPDVLFGLGEVPFDLDGDDATFEYA